MEQPMTNSAFNDDESNQIVFLKAMLYTGFLSKLVEMPENLASLIKTHGIITGGATSSIYHKSEVNDWDVYLKTEEALEQFKHMVENDILVKSIVADVREEYRNFVGKNGKVITENAVTFKNKVQVITRSIAKESRKNFDFVHCMPYYDLSDDKFYISRNQYESIKNKRIVVNDNYNGTTMGITERVKKYFDRGWAMV
jgi:hypothetical protein